MFEQATLSGGPLSTRLWSTCAGFTGQVVFVGILLLVPLIWPAALPQVQSYMSLVAPGPPPPPPPPPPDGFTVRPRGATRVAAQSALTLPTRIPDRVAQIVDDPPEVSFAGVQGGVPGGVAGGQVNGIVGSVLTEGAFAPPPPVKPVERAQAKESPPVAPIRVREGGRVKLASPIRRIEPVYPPLARTARIEGVVELEGIIGIDGRMHELKVKSGHPFLVKAAVEAVSQWVYTPGTLNGDLVEVIAPITITFRLGR
jgi:protein TonB